jgi:hypothetical protein
MRKIGARKAVQASNESMKLHGYLRIGLRDQKESLKSLSFTHTTHYHYLNQVIEQRQNLP